MELSIRLGHALHDLSGFLNSGFRNGHRLEAPFQCSILFDMLAIFIKSGGTDNLDLASAEGRLQDIGSVHRTFRIACTNQVMNLIDDQNDIAAFLYLADKALHSAFELAAELGTGNQCRQIQQEYFLILQFIRDISFRNPLCQAFRDSRLTDTGLTNQAGIILLPTVEDLDHPFRFHISTDHLIQLSLPGTGGQIHTVGIQELMLLILLFLGWLLPFLGILLSGRFLFCRHIACRTK